jgi:uncharacterized protein YecE (DUF72 family)
MARITIGTCGYSYKDWVGPVYPPGTKPIEMLPLYAQRFAIVEIDATYYGVPAPATFASMVRRTPPTFRFTAKLPSAGTHLPELGSRAVHDDVQLFRSNVQPLVEANRLVAVLAQFPNAFRPNDATRSYLGMLRGALPDVSLAAEFRHREWQTNATLELLRELDIALVLVDQPHFKTLVRETSDVTSDLAYIRFHGRNVQNWWRGTNATRYDYLYTEEELQPWLQRIVDIAANPDVKEVLAFMNNHPHGKAVRNAELLTEMARAELGDDAVTKAPEEPAGRAFVSLFEPSEK